MTSDESTENANMPTLKGKCVSLFRQNLLVTLTLVGVGVGFIVGFVVAPMKPSASAIMWIGMLGELYIRMLKMMIVPLVVCSVISGTAAMDPKSNGKISGVCLGYIMVTNCIPAILGAVVCVLVKPGEGVDSGVDINALDREIMETEDIFADLLRNIVPDNLVASCFQQAQTKYDWNKTMVVKTNGTHNYTEEVKTLTKKYIGAANSTNILGLIIVSTIFGLGSASMKESGKAFLEFFRSATDIIIRILRVLIWSTPVGVASLCAKTIAATDDVADDFRKLGLYFLTVMVVLVVWGFVVIPIIFYIFRRTNPFKFLGSIIPSIMIVFATGSTVIALPESFRSLEEKNGVDKRISRFVAPLSATIGRAGSSIYIASSCIFIIQMVDMETSASNVLLVIILTSISTLAIPSVTGASLITVLILLTALNIPGESAAMLFALEFFLDRSRSVVNLNTQLTGVIVTQKTCAAALAEIDYVDVKCDIITDGDIIVERNTKDDGITNNAVSKDCDQVESSHRM